MIDDRDRNLWLALKNGNRMALSQIYSDYHQLLYNFGRQFTPDDELIRDCIQDLFVELWHRRERHPVPDHPKAYLFRSVRNNLVRRLTSEQKRIRTGAAIGVGDIPFDPVPVPMADAETTLIRRETDAARRHAFSRAFTKLTPRQKEAVFLRFYEDFDYGEIARVLSISKKAAYKLLYRALDVLRENISDPMG